MSSCPSSTPSCLNPWAAQPKGVILYGPPGTGKTLLARAVAHHTDCCFIRVSGSELVQKYIGEGARMVRELFVMARENAPAILFMDEVDSIGSARGSGGGDSEVQRTMLELLNQLDGFEASNQIKVIMATNRLDILDAALLRPGRIDRKIEFPNPTEDSRVDILKIHSRKMNLVRGIDLVGTPLVAFRNLVAAGDDPQVFNGTCGAESGWVPVSAVVGDVSSITPPESGESGASSLGRQASRLRTIRDMNSHAMRRV